jgi:hypothetical protein
MECHGWRDTFTRGVNGTGDGWTLDSYFSVNIAGGATSISITHTTASAPFLSVIALEVSDVIAFHVNSKCTTNPGNGMAQANSSTATSGSISPVPGDFLVNYNFTFAGPTLTTAYGPVAQANIAWHLLASQLIAAQALMYGQYNSSSAFSPAMTQGTDGGSEYASCSMAFTTGISGSGIPTGEQIIGSQSETVGYGSANRLLLSLPPAATRSLGFSIPVFAQLSRALPAVRQLNGR